MTGAASSAYRFYFAGTRAKAIVAATGGPGLGWEYALKEALRQRARRRGDSGWRSVTTAEIVPLSMGSNGTWMAHVQVTTTRGEIVELWVKRQSP
jgi:hypothetical protein